MYRLAFWLLPYALAIGGLLTSMYAGSVLVTGGEKAPTTLHVSTLSTDTPDAQWLKITGAGLYVAGTIEDVSVHKKTGVRTVSNYYVPVLTPTQATARTRAGGLPIRNENPAPVLVELSPEQFRKLFPGYASGTSNEWYRQQEIQGTRTTWPTASTRFRDYARNNLGVDPRVVTVVGYETTPLNRGEAFRLLVGSIAAGVAGLMWSALRFSGGVI